MSRDSRDSYDGADGRNGAGPGSGSGNGGRPSPSRSSHPSNPRSASGGSRGPGAFGPNGLNGLIKPPLSGLDGDGRSRPPSNPRSRPGGPPSSIGGSHSNNNHTLARMHTPRGPRRPPMPDPADDSMEVSVEAPRPHRGGRSVAQMARDLSRSLSRSIHALGTSFSRVVRDAGTYERPGAPRPQLPDELREEIEQQPYRRSRRRVVARKWRRRRIGPNPIAYACVVMLLLLVVVLVLGVGGAGGVYAVTYYNSHQSQIRDIYNLRFTQGTQIYDRNGTLLYVAQADDTGLNIYEPLTHIGKKLQLATIETEDHTFWTNDGVDLQRTIGAAIADTKSGGSATQGGSTITQQLVKNIVAKDNNKTITRKLNEAILAYGVTINYTKAQILEMYLNTLDYGDRNTGIETAARNYFGLQEIKNPDGTVTEASEQLDWWQAAIMAGIPNAPGKYLPIQYSCDSLDASGQCPDTKWANPCLNNPHEPVCNPNPNYDYRPGVGDGHEWLVYRRSLVVLDSLLRYDDITQQQHDDAVAKIHDCLVKECMGHWLAFNGSSNGTSQDRVAKLAPHFVDYVLKELVEDYGVTDPAHTALKVYTTLDYPLQQYAQKTVQYYVAQPHAIRWPEYAPHGCTTCLQPSLGDYANGHDGAVVAIDPHTGDIMAMVGSVDYTDKSAQVAGNVNVATAPRSMGSSTKAIVYATAFQMGWNPGVMLQDQPLCYPVPATISDPGQPDDGQPVEDNDAPACQGWYVPHNFEAESFSGNAPIRVMLANSLNIPATEAMCYVGCTAVTSQDIISMANRMGIDTLTPGRMGPTTALGTQEIPLLELTSAFGTFAAAGKHVPYRSILKIEGPDGSTLYNAPAPQAIQAMSPQAAYMMTSVLTDNQARTADFNTESPLYFPDFDVASKTGTSQGTTGPRDIITMGYTPYLAVGAWVGNADNTDLKPHIIGISGAGYIFADIIQWAHDNYKWPNARFPVPPDMARGQFNCVTGLAPYANVGVQPCSLNMYKSGSTNLYCGWGCATRVDEDWYIQGQEWLQS